MYVLCMCRVEGVSEIDAHPRILGHLFLGLCVLAWGCRGKCQRQESAVRSHRALYPVSLARRNRIASILIIGAPHTLLFTILRSNYPVADIYDFTKSVLVPTGFIARGKEKKKKPKKGLFSLFGLSSRL